MNAAIQAVMADEGKLGKSSALLFSNARFALSLFCALVFTLLFFLSFGRLLVQTKTTPQVQSAPSPTQATPITPAAPAVPVTPPPPPKKEEVPEKFKEYLNY